MIAPQDLAACREAIRTGSRSFHAASHFLPARVRDPSLALYAFCRLADDAVDLGREKDAAVLRLRDRLDAAYAGRPFDAAADRAFAAMVEAVDLPRALPDALLEGLAWDAMERRYGSLSDLRAYSARVASAVGAMMTVIMGVRSADALARACDLGVAMQLTNIARDIGEDAREGRLYIPLDWMAEEGLDPEAFLAAPAPCPRTRRLARRLLTEARRLYQRADPGISALPLSSRAGVFAARHVYAAIGAEIAAGDYNSITKRARTTGRRKLALGALSLLRAGASVVAPVSPVLHAAPLPETRFLVDAAARRSESRVETRVGDLIDALATLERRERARRGALAEGVGAT